MNKRLCSTKLEKKLIASILLSLIISYLLTLLVSTAGEAVLSHYYDASTILQDKNKEALSDFKSYITKNKISINDHDKIETWVRDYKYIDLYIFKDNKLLYDSNRYDVNNASESLLFLPSSSNNYTDISFQDQDAKIYIDSYFEYKYYNIMSSISILIGFLCFVITMLTLIRKKISYIGTLENEIKILEGGDLNYCITVQGHDELGLLAESIDEMRKSIIERLENENEARTANSELITAISHDLRTPLTALLGYLDIIEYKKYSTTEALMQYIHNSREKAYQIKTLSDKLFEYFLVFDKKNELELETFPLVDLFNQLFEEEFFMLYDQNFTFDFVPCDTMAYININLISIRRVFDNIFSNISKYADHSKPIRIRYFIEHETLIVTLENKIKQHTNTVNSTGIGLKTCSKILEMHNGDFHTEKTGDDFTVVFQLPIKLVS
ncbi:MAG: HAMP domain-containing sensor histidine kinase [bacterium]|nr:HAMP domain-containing sensor histidine kinase [bacterium]